MEDNQQTEEEKRVLNLMKNLTGSIVELENLAKKKGHVTKQNVEEHRLGISVILEELAEEMNYLIEIQLSQRIMLADSLQYITDLEKKYKKTA